MINNYLVNLANPKSAILALPLCMNILAILRSLCITFLSARYSNPKYISLMMGRALSYVKVLTPLNFDYRSP